MFCSDPEGCETMSEKAVYFDGNTYLQNDSLSAMPASSPYGFISYWTNAVFNVDTASATVLKNGVAPDGQWTISISQSSMNCDGLAGLVIVLHDDPNVAGQMVRWSNGATDFIPYDGLWHHTMISWNTQTGSCVAYFDNTPVTMSSLPGVDSGPFDMSFNGYVWRVGVADPNDTFVSPSGVNETAFIGSLAELFFLTGTPVDITDPAIRAKFIDPSTLQPIPIDAGGLWPFFDTTGDVPQIFLSGNADMFPRNYPSWSATCVSQTDSTPSSTFYVPAASNPLQTATDSPFGPPIS